MSAPNITIYKQILPTQCQALANLGYRSIINLRPDHETEGQPLSAALQDAASDAKVAYYHLPCQADAMNAAMVNDLAAQIRDLPQPILLFCATGFRAKRLYQIARLQGLLA